ncbi:unnamed protein product [Lampetra fluviatilis]
MAEPGDGVADKGGNAPKRPPPPTRSSFPDRAVHTSAPPSPAASVRVRAVYAESAYSEAGARVPQVFSRWRGRSCKKSPPWEGDHHHTPSNSR